MNAKNKSIRQITKNNAEDWAPVWINKNEISYLRQEGGEIKRIKQNLNTQKTEQLEHPEVCLLDDKNIVYSQTSGMQLYTCKGDIFMRENEYKSSENLTTNIKGNASYVSWINDKKAITFTSNHEGNNDIYTLELKTKNF